MNQLPLDNWRPAQFSVTQHLQAQYKLTQTIVVLKRYYTPNLKLDLRLQLKSGWDFSEQQTSAVLQLYSFYSN